MKIEILADADTVARKAAAIIAAEARDAVVAHGQFILAVSGGRTPWLMLRALAGEKVPWEQLHLVQVDERIAPAGHPDRNLTHLRESLLTRVPLLPEQVNAMIERFLAITLLAAPATVQVRAASQTVQ